MAKAEETRYRVEDIKSHTDLVAGDKVVITLRKGLQFESKATFTYGYARDGMIKTEGHDDVMPVRNFMFRPTGFDSVSTDVWRKVPKKPEPVGAVIFVVSTTLGNDIGKAFYRRNRQGSWTSMDKTERTIAGNEITEWTPVTLTATK